MKCSFLNSRLLIVVLGSATAGRSFKKRIKSLRKVCCSKWQTSYLSNSSHTSTSDTWGTNPHLCTWKRRHKPAAEAEELSGELAWTSRSSWSKWGLTFLLQAWEGFREGEVFRKRILTTPAKSQPRLLLNPNPHETPKRRWHLLPRVMRWLKADLGFKLKALALDPKVEVARNQLPFQRITIIAIKNQWPVKKYFDRITLYLYE